MEVGIYQDPNFSFLSSLEKSKVNYIVSRSNLDFLFEFLQPRVNQKKGQSMEEALFCSVWNSNFRGDADKSSDIYRHLLQFPKNETSTTMTWDELFE